MDNYRIRLAYELAKEYSIKKFNFETANSPKEFLEFFNITHSELLDILRKEYKQLQNEHTDSYISKNLKDYI